jgi:hypothetical protein
MAFKKGLQERLPHLSERKPLCKLERDAAVLIKEERIYIEPKKPGKGTGFMRGMWGFPDLPEAWKGTLLCGFSHSITRYRIRVRAFLIHKKKIKGHYPGKWVRIDGLEKYPMPSADKRIADCLKPSLTHSSGLLLHR